MASLTLPKLVNCAQQSLCMTAEGTKQIHLTLITGNLHTRATEQINYWESELITQP